MSRIGQTGRRFARRAMSAHGAAGSTSSASTETERAEIDAADIQGDGTVATEGGATKGGAARPARVLYGRRRGRRLNAGRARLLVDRLDALRPPPLDDARWRQPDRLFAVPVERIWLEIGFGSGDHLIAQAARNPTVGLIGAEPFLNGVANALKLLTAAEATGAHDLAARLRLWPDDGRPLLAALPEGALDRCFVLYPDPWPKTRHWHRRFIVPETVALLARALGDGAELRLATDVPDLARWMAHIVAADPAFVWLGQGPTAEPPADWVPTRYERKALAAGRQPHYLLLRRRPRG